MILEGTLIRMQRHRIDRPFFSGKHRHHGMNLQAITSPTGEVIVGVGTVRGSIHDDTAVRILPLPRFIRKAGLFTLGDKGYHGLDEALVVTPLWGRGKPAWQKEPDQLHARLRAPGERAFAQIK